MTGTELRSENRRQYAYGQVLGVLERYLAVCEASPKQAAVVRALVRRALESLGPK